LADASLYSINTDGTKPKAKARLTDHALRRKLDRKKPMPFVWRYVMSKIGLLSMPSPATGS